ncbi:MAG: 50S ribosomal protein L34 [Candidatus Margulisbacteria bacterium]|nr:50S ribosomal protein L34 [Candidatus Margulisiibacteriota bacterium]
MVKRTFQPHKRSRKSTHGYLVKKKTVGGRRVLKKRLKKGRKRLAP